jgi:hypothetical protein
MTLLRQRMLEDLRIRNYAPTTVDCYVRSVANFAKHFNKRPDQLGRSGSIPHDAPTTGSSLDSLH